MYTIKCKVSGGITGTRFGELKNKKGQVVIFTERKKAERKARQLNKKMNSANATAYFRYDVAEW